MGKLLAIVLTLLALAALALLALRPAAVIGVSDGSMEQALGDSAGSSVECDGAGGEDDRFRCATAGADAGSGDDRARYDVTVDDWGCWDAKAGKGKSLSDCITVIDLIG